MTRAGFVGIAALPLALALAGSGRAHADAAPADAAATPLVLPDLAPPARAVAASAALLTDGHHGVGLVDLRGSLAVTSLVQLGVRLPLVIGTSADNAKTHGFGVGDLALSVGVAHVLPVDAGGTYRAGARVVVGLGTALGTERLLRTAALLELAHTPGEIFNQDIAARLEAGLRWDTCGGGYELAGSVGKANHLEGDETLDERFTFYGLAAGGYLRLAHVDVLAEAMMVTDDFSRQKAADLGVRLHGARALTARVYTTAVGNEYLVGLAIAGALAW